MSKKNTPKTAKTEAPKQDAPQTSPEPTAGAPENQETVQTAPTPPKAPEKAKKYVFTQNVMHNGVMYAKDESANDLEQPDFDKLEASGMIVEYVKPKTSRDVQKALKNGEEGFKFVCNVMHDGVQYSQGASADKLSAELKKDFISKGFVQFQ